MKICNPPRQHSNPWPANNIIIYCVMVKTEVGYVMIRLLLKCHFNVMNGILQLFYIHCSSGHADTGSLDNSRSLWLLLLLEGPGKYLLILELILGDKARVQNWRLNSEAISQERHQLSVNQYKSGNNFTLVPVWEHPPFPVRLINKPGN
ncbi:hypothetical protein C0J52_21455 [Blattella germanica]|nr:hypothetical protein C0J52_21455 [Blattella germanica]